MKTADSHAQIRNLNCKIDRCPVCGSENVHQKNLPTNYSLSVCDNCALLWEENSRSDKDLYQKSYFLSSNPRAGYSNYAEAVAINSKTFHRRLDRLEHLLGRRGKILDVGCALGTCLEEARKMGWNNCQGLELSHYAVEYCRKRGLKVTEGTLLQNHELPPKSFDAILMQDMIEHVSDPVSNLKVAFQLLKPGGLLYLVTPNTWGFWSRVLGSYWYHYKPSEHLVYFNPHSIRTALNNAGFIDVTIKPTLNFLSIGYILDRMKYLAPKFFGTLFNIIKLVNLDGLGIWVPIDEIQAWGRAASSVEGVKIDKKVIESTLVVIPTYNELGCIAQVIEQVFRVLPGAQVLVVDDNSPDGTGALVEKLAAKYKGVHLLSRRQKQGLGKAYNAGFEWALSKNFSCVVQMDADFSHRPQDVTKLLAAISHADVAIGCRYSNGGSTENWSWWRRAISRMGNWYAKTILGLPYHDLTGGFNAWRTSALRQIQPQSTQSKGYSYQVELKWRAHHAGLTLSEVPIQFDDRKNGRSKMSLHIAYEAVLRLLRLRREKEKFQSEMNCASLDRKAA